MWVRNPPLALEVRLNALKRTCSGVRLNALAVIVAGFQPAGSVLNLSVTVYSIHLKNLHLFVVRHFDAVSEERN